MFQKVGDVQQIEIAMWILAVIQLLFQYCTAMHSHTRWPEARHGGWLTPKVPRRNSIRDGCRVDIRDPNCSIFCASMYSKYNYQENTLS